jgi:putative membrane protein
MAAGAIGGLVAAFVMNQTSSAIQALPQAWKQERIALAGQQGGQHNRPEKYGKPEQESEDATQKIADKIVQAVLHRPLNKEAKKIAGPVVHYAFGAVVGAIYGAAAEKLPVNKAAGVPFGAAVWLGADEIGVPAAGLSGPLTKYPLSVHLNALAGHIAYGVTTELVRRGVRAVL